MTRKQAIEWIRVYAAQGDLAAATRVYVEHRISRSAYNQAVRDGRARAASIAKRDQEHQSS